MTDQFYTKTTALNSNFTPKGLLDLYPTDQDGYKLDSVVLPVCSLLPSSYSVQPRSGLSNTPITNTSITDFVISTPDYISSMYATMQIINTTVAAVDLRSYLLFQKLEFLDSNNNILSTLYTNNFIDKFIMMNQFAFQRLAPAEAITFPTFAPVSIAAGATQNVTIAIPGMMNQNSIKTSLINSGLFLRFYMQPNAINNPAGVNISQFSLIVYGARYFSKQQAYDTQIKSSLDLKFRFLNPTRALLTSAPLAPSNTYNFQLVSGAGLSAYLVFRIYDAVFNFTTALKYYPVSTLQFNDKSNTIVGIQYTSAQMQTILNKNFPGYILEYNVLNANDYSNLYIIPFTINPQLAHSGNVSGLYSLTGYESINFTLPASFVAGTYGIEVMSYNYSVVEINNGVLSGFQSQ